MSEIVYVLINEAMDGYVKIGRTNDLEQRMRSLDNTSVPLPFECFYAARVNNSTFVETQLHNAFADRRVRKNREFFEIAPERVRAALSIGAIEEVTPGVDFVESEDDQRALDKARTMRARFNFRMVDISPGAVLQFTRDPNITCTVVDTTKVEFEDEDLSLTAAAFKVMRSMGYNWKALSGPEFWEYESETLDARRRRFEMGDEE